MSLKISHEQKHQWWDPNLVLRDPYGSWPVVPMTHKKVNNFESLDDAYMHQWCGSSSLAMVMAYHLFSAKPLPELMLTYCQWTLTNKLQRNSNQNTMFFIQGNAFENAICNMSAILFWPQWQVFYSCRKQCRLLIRFVSNSWNILKGEYTSVT